MTRGIVISFGPAYENRHFDTVAQETMALVEEAATYLDGPGRKAVKELPRNHKFLYGSESMRLTGFLLTLAGWVIAQRTVREYGGTKSADAAQLRKARDMIRNPPWSVSAEHLEQLPQDFVRLRERAIALHTRIMAIENIMAQSA
ncbi:MAG: DUF1465 family protein [Candidatus Pacebacteria bacterium]|nr:DUF1465 family protein [Candidatus Paceibacterota bacterium]